MYRILVVVLLLSSVATAEFDPSRLAFEAAHFDLQPLPAAGRSQASWSQLSDVRLHYEDIHLRARQLRFRLHQPREGQVIPEVATVQDLHLDSSDSSWRGQLFRGELQASAMHLQRLPDSQRYDIRLEGLQPLAGEVLVNGHWRPFSGDVASALVQLRLSSGEGLGSPVLETARLLPASDTEQVHLSLMDAARQWQLAADELQLSGDEQGLRSIHLSGEPQLSSQDDQELLRVQAAQSIELPLRPGGAGAAREAVQFQLGETFRLWAAQAEWQLATSASRQRPELEHLSLMPAADGQLRVRYEAAAGVLRQLRLRCAQARMQRLPGEGGQARYHLTLQVVAPATGMLQEADGQLPIELQAARLEAEVEQSPDQQLLVTS
ncbi:MAG: hypothetical protein ACOCXA_08825, partial [Planctomycetota bacterium]